MGLQRGVVDTPLTQRQTPLDPEADTPQEPMGRAPPVETATEAGGTHPTGVHSC